MAGAFCSTIPAYRRRGAGRASRSIGFRLSFVRWKLSAGTTRWTSAQGSRASWKGYVALSNRWVDCSPADHGWTEEHGDGAGPIVSDVEAVAIGAHRQRFGIAANIDGLGHPLGNGVDGRHTAITEVADVGVLAVGTDPHAPRQIADRDSRRFVGNHVDN